MRHEENEDASPGDKKSNRESFEDSGDELFQKIPALRTTAEVAALQVSTLERAQLEQWVRRRTSAHRLVVRSRIVLLTSRGSSVASVVVILGARAQPAAAAPIASLEYIETVLDGGLFQYDYTLFNLGDPETDADFDVYDVALFFSPATSLVNASVASGWDFIAGVGFLDAFSVLPGPSPSGADVAPGQMLGVARILFEVKSAVFRFKPCLRTRSIPSTLWSLTV